MFPPSCILLVGLLGKITIAQEPAAAKPPSAKPSATPLYKNPNAAIEDRVNDLIGRMTIQEKVGQM